MIWVLGLADTMAGLIFLGTAFDIKLPATMIISFSLYLIIKGAIFVLNSLDLGSAIDVLAGIILLANLFLNPPAILLIPLAVYLAGKGLLSMLA